MSSTNPKLYGIGAFEFKKEATFGATDTSSMSPLRLVEPMDRSGLTYEALDHAFIKDSIYHAGPIPGAKNGTVTVKVYVHGSSSSDPAGAPTVYTNPLSVFFAQALGNASAGGYTTGETGSDTGTLKAPDLSSFTKGQGVVWNTASNGTQMGWLSDIDTTTTPDEGDLSQTAVAVPSGGKIFGTSTAYMTSGYDWADSGNSFTLRYSSHDTDDQVTMSGCRVSGLRITYETRQLVTAEIDFMVASWTEGSGSGAQPYAWDYATPEALVSARVAYGATAATTMRLSGFTFDVGLEVVEDTDPNSTQGIGGFTVIQRKPTITFSTFRDVSEWPTRFENPDANSKFSFVFGSGAGKMMGIYIPSAIVAEYPQPTDLDGRIGSEVTLYACEYYGDTAGTPTGLQNTDCRISIT